MIAVHVGEATLCAGRWEDALRGRMVGAVVTDPPYSVRVHQGHDDAAEMANQAGKRWPREGRATGDPRRPRSSLDYAAWTRADVHAFVASWAPRCAGWFVCLSDSDLCPAYRSAFEAAGLTAFQPVPILMPGMTVRLCGDGPSSWAVYANVARPKALSKWGTLPGGYYGKPHRAEEEDAAITGGKPLWLMRTLVRDYTKPGDLIADPCAGSGTTLLAALIEGRRAVGAEVSPSTYLKAVRRLRSGYTPSLFSGRPSYAADGEQLPLLG